MHCSDNQQSSQHKLILTNKPDVAHDPLHATFSIGSNLKSRQHMKRGQILFRQVFPRSWCFHKRLSDCVTPQKAEGCDPLRPSTIPSRWTRGQHCCQISSNEPPCAACAVCQSPAYALTGPQTPVDSTPTCPTIAQATSCLGNLKALVPV